MEVHEFSVKFSASIQTIEESLELLMKITRAIEVKPVAFHAQMFPVIQGGGVGITATMNFVESYCCLDTWPELSYAHLVIISCKKFSKRKVEEILAWEEHEHGYGIEQSEEIEGQSEEMPVMW